jgi:hypothetical protein
MGLLYFMPSSAKATFFGSVDLASRIAVSSMCMLFQCAAKMKSSLNFFL